MSLMCGTYYNRMLINILRILCWYSEFQSCLEARARVCGNVEREEPVPKLYIPIYHRR